MMDVVTTHHTSGCHKSHDKTQSCYSLSGVRRVNGGGHGQQMASFREDKENIPHEDEDEDGPILYRDEESMEDEGGWCLHKVYECYIIGLPSDRLAAKLARKESLSMKLQQRPGKQELIDRNILFQVTEEERKQERTIIGAKLIRRLSLRPTPEELEDRNILKSRMKNFLGRVNQTFKTDHFRIRQWRNEKRSWREETVPATKT